MAMAHQAVDAQADQDRGDEIADRRRAAAPLPSSAAASTTTPIAAAWPIAIGTSDLATALAFCCCIPSATANSHPIPGLIPWYAPRSSISHNAVEPDLRVGHDGSE